jgi:O-antigen/teichoic acid export membrane protein
VLDLIKSTSRNSIIYGFGNISIKLVGLILIPIYTNPVYLSVNDYGVLGIVEITSQVLIALLGLALFQALTRWFFDTNHLQHQKAIFFTVLLSTFLISVIVFTAFFPFAGWFSYIIFNNNQYTYLLRLMFLSSCLQVIGQIPLTLLKLQSKPGLYSISSVIKLFITLGLTIYFILGLNRGLEGIYEAQVIGGIVFLIFLGRYIFNNIKFKFKLRILVSMLQFSWPLVLGSISGMLLSIFDRYSLNYLAELKDVSIYSLGFKVANTIKIVVVNSVQLAISPIIFQMMDKEGNKRFYSKLMTYFSFLVMIFVLVLSAYGLEILKIFTVSKEYWKAYTVIPVLFGMMKDTALIGLQIQKKTKIIGIVIFLIAILNLGLNILLIPRFKIMGAAFATLVSQIMFFFIIYMCAQKYYFIPFELKKLLIIILTGTFIIVISLLLSGSNQWLRLILKTILIVSYPFVLYIFRFYEPLEIQKLKGFVKKWYKPSEWLNYFRDLISSD